MDGSLQPSRDSLLPDAMFYFQEVPASSEGKPSRHIGRRACICVYIFFQINLPPNLHTWGNLSKKNTYDLGEYSSTKATVRGMP